MTILTIGFILIAVLVVLVLMGMQIATLYFPWPLSESGSSATASGLPSECWN